MRTLAARLHHRRQILERVHHFVGINGRENEYKQACVYWVSLDVVSEGVGRDIVDERGASRGIERGALLHQLHRVAREVAAPEAKRGVDLQEEASEISSLRPHAWVAYGLRI